MARPKVLDVERRRKQLGAWYTPAELVEHLTRLTLGGMRRDRPLTVLDPACGDGRFLVAAAQMLGPDCTLIGIDIDPHAVAAARSALPTATVIEADARSIEWSRWSVDAVIGNPPFLNQMASSTSRGGASAVGGGPYADVAAEFLALAAAAVSPGGRVGLVLPQSILSVRDAAAIRESVASRASVVHAWWSTRKMFDAAVHTCALVLEAGGVQGAVARTRGPEFEPCAATSIEQGWGALVIDEPLDHAPVRAADRPTLGSIASFALDFRDQYYGLVDAVGDDRVGPPLVTSGLIEPGRCLWGERPVRFAKRRFDAPRVDLSALSPRMQRWADQRLTPKVLIANQTRTVEAVIDREGAWLPSVPVLTCTAQDLDAVMAVLASPETLAWLRPRAAGSGLSPSAIRLTPALLGGVPLP
jgi:SAM-dependent methyltransferase